MSLLTNLTAYWKLDEASGNALDSQGTNDLTDTNSVGTTSGVVGNARQFARASTQYFIHADNPDLSTGNIDFTLSAWVKLDSKLGSMGIVCKDESSSGEWFFYYKAGTDRFAFQVAGGSGYSNSAEVLANNFGSPSTGVWYHVVAWHTASTEIAIAVNAGTPDTLSHTTGVFDGTSNFRIGNDSFLDRWDGSIDELGLWKRVLTSAERTSLYNSGAGLAFSSFGGGGATHPLFRAGSLSGLGSGGPFFGDPLAR